MSGNSEKTPLVAPVIRVHGKSVATPTEGIRRENCLYCNDPIRKPRLGKDFCSDKCRWKWNNNQKKKALERVARKFIGFLKEEGLEYLLRE